MVMNKGDSSYDGTMRFDENWTNEMKNDFYSLQYWNLHFYVMKDMPKYTEIRKKFIEKYNFDHVSEMERMFMYCPDYTQFWKERGIDNIISKKRA